MLIIVTVIMETDPAKYMTPKFGLYNTHEISISLTASEKCFRAIRGSIIAPTMQSVTIRLARRQYDGR